MLIVIIVLLEGISLIIIGIVILFLVAKVDIGMLSKTYRVVASVASVIRPALNLYF